MSGELRAARQRKAAQQFLRRPSRTCRRRAADGSGAARRLPQAIVRPSSSTVAGAFQLRSPVRQFRIFTRSPFTSVQAPGAGDRPRIRQSISRAAFVQSMRVSSFENLLGVGHAIFGLLSARRPSRVPAPQTLAPSGQRRAAPARRAARHRSCARSVARSAISTGPVSRPSSMRMTHHAGLRIACHDRALDRRGAAPARQQRAVQIEAAQPRRIQDRFRQDQPVGDDDRRIELRAPRTLPVAPHPSATPACAPRSRAPAPARAPATAQSQGRAPWDAAAGNRRQAMSWPWAISSASVGTANSGVPMNARRSVIRDPHPSTRPE